MARQHARGSAGPGAAGAAPRSFWHSGAQIRPIVLSKQEVENYYHGMANRTLWPLYHDAIRTPSSTAPGGAPT